MANRVLKKQNYFSAAHIEGIRQGIEENYKNEGRENKTVYFNETSTLILMLCDIHNMLSQLLDKERDN